MAKQGAGRTRWRRIAAAASLLVAMAARAEAPSILDRVLAPGATRDEHLNAAQKARYRLRLEAGESVDLAFTQFDATLQLHWQALSGEASPVYQNDAGRQARVRLTLVAEIAGDITVDVGVKGDAAAHYAVHSGAVHSATTADRRRATAQRALADAETLRRAAGSIEQGKGKEADELPARVIARYQAAIDDGKAAADWCTVSMALAGQARWHFAHGDYAQTRTLAEAALPTHCGGDDEAWAAAEAAVAERTLGSALGYQGDLIASTATSERALAHYRQTGDPAYQAMVLGNLSANYRVLGETHRALDSAQASVDLAQQLGDAKRALFSRESMASIRLQRGELAPALALYRQVVADLKTTPYPLIEGMSWNDLGLLYGRLGDPRAADDAFARASAAWSASGDESGLAETRLNAADALLDGGRVDAAEAAYREALAFDRARHFQREEIHALSGLGRVAMARDERQAAAEHFAAARDLARTLHAQNLEAGAHQALGDLASRRGDTQAARAAYAESARLAEAVGDRATRVSARASIARLDAEAGDLAQAEEGIAQALTLIESERVAIPDPQLRTAYFATQRAYYSLYIDVLMRRHAHDPRGDFAARALEVAERARARALVDLLVAQRIDVLPRVDAALGASLRLAEDRRREQAWQQAQWPRSAGAAAREALQREMDQSERDLDALRGQVRAADPRYAALAQPESLSLSEVRKTLLDDRTAAFEYWLDEPHSTVWRITQAGIEAASLPGRAAIEKDIAALRERLRGRGAVIDGPIDALAEREAKEAQATLVAARALGDVLLPERLRGGAKRQVIVGDGAIALIPFALFADGATTQAYVPSLASWRELRRLPRAEKSRRYAVLADPVFRADDARLRPDAALNPPSDAARAVDLRRLPRLPHTRREVQAIARWSEEAPWVATDFAATRRAVLEADWSRFAGAHFATHALLDLRNPELSGVVLSLFDANGVADDGFVRVGDLYHLRMPLDLVVLSVCDSAEGALVEGEGIFSLARGFFYAGVRRVVASLWPVDDRASAEFMGYFYAALLRDHAAPEEALRQAQARLRAIPRWSAPTYWAGFVLQGDGGAAR